MNINGATYISSFDRPASSTYDNATYTLYNTQNLSAMALHSFDFIYGINNINVNNRTSYFETSSQSFAPILTTGNYDYSTLSVEVLAKLNALGLGTWTLTFDNDIYTLTAPVPVRFITNIQGRRDWFDMLGFSQYRNTGLQTVFVGGVANIAYTDCIYILCDELHRRQTVRDVNSNGRISSVLAVVYINKDQRMSKDDVMTHIVEPKHITDRVINPKYTFMDILYKINSISIRLVDMQGLNLPPVSAGNGSCEYTLEIGCMNQDPIGF